MKEYFIKTLQKFLNANFTYADLLILTDRLKNKLLQEHILEKMEASEYNAIWNTLIDVEEMFRYANSPNLIIGSTYSMDKLYEKHYGQGKYNRITED